MRRFLLLLLILPTAAFGQHPYYVPYEGQPGKDVIWVPTPMNLVEKMLDMIKVGPKDYVIDLGSGDGRNIIAAAKRGANALGVEWDADLVATSRKRAEEAGVADKAKFLQADMYTADISKATALVLFLLPINLEKLTPRFLELQPGTRIVNNGYRIPGWEEAETGRLGIDCLTWCTAYLYYVPAKVGGKWRLPAGVLQFQQDFQTLSGTLTTKDGRTLPVRGSVKSDRVYFTVGLDAYEGRVRGKQMTGQASGAVSGFWKAAKLD